MTPAPKRADRPDRLSGLRAANAAREEERLQRMAALANFAIDARQAWPWAMSKTIAHDFAKASGAGEAAARAMLTELEQLGLVPRRRP